MLRVFDADTLAAALSPGDLRDHCERALIAAGTTELPQPPGRQGMWLVVKDQGEPVDRAISAPLADALAAAALATIAAKHLAVAAPRSIGIIGAGPTGAAAITELVHFYGPELELRVTAAPEAPPRGLANSAKLRVVPAHRAAACDIVCVVDSSTLERGWLCEGSHLNLLGPGASVSDGAGLRWTGSADARETGDLPGREPLALVARGVTAGRESGEITLYRPTTNERELALAALASRLRTLAAELGTLFDVGGAH